jgi:hypothetical protein
MLDSLIENSQNPKIFILALDSITFDCLTSLYVNNSNIIVLNELEINNCDLSKLKTTRKYFEYCWALSSILCNFVLSNHNEDVIYVDADLYFFSEVESLITECKLGDTAITPHRFSHKYRKLVKNGIYNVQWVYFKNNANGRRISTDWMQNCIVSTSYDVEAGIVGDQKYLDEWPQKFENVKIIENIGAGVAPWNQENYTLHQKDELVIIDNQIQLIFFHFHSLKVLLDKFVILADSTYRIGKDTKDIIYIKYLKEYSKRIMGKDNDSNLIILPRFVSKLLIYFYKFRLTPLFYLLKNHTKV